jgi:uncharacterized protein YbjT (DUF2867 family)
MKLVVFGATGGTGKNVLERALAEKHDVIAVVRKPGAIAEREHLRVVRGDVLAPETLPAALEPGAVVISTIGPSNNKQPGTLISEGIRNVVAASTAAGVKRIVFESGLMMTDGRELSLLARAAVAMFRRLNWRLYEEKLKAEATLRSSSLEWVIVRPPGLDHSPATSRYVVGPGVRVSPFKTLSHADAADFLVKAATDAQWTQQTVNIGHA